MEILRIGEDVSPVVKLKFSIVIPIVDSPPTIVSLPDEQALMALGGELIVVRDRWGNACRTRNMGAAKSSGRDVYCVS